MEEEGLSIEEKLKIVAGFILDSPPGEVNDVINDVKVLMNDNAVFQEGILDALQQYNTEQFITVIPPGQEGQVIVSKYGQIENNLFLDPKSHRAFRVDHLRQIADDEFEAELHAPDEATEPLRAIVETAISEYVADHYPNGVSSTYSTDGTLTIAIVDNKYNPANFWNGRWRSIWVISPESGELKGTIKVNVHYYEDGNVQLNSTKEIETTSSVNSEDLIATATAYARAICNAENDFQTSLNESYIELSEHTFKGLRRALPLTRHKLDWDKISNYKIGHELANKSS